MTDATVVRIWRTQIDQSRADEYDEFVRGTSLPMFRAQQGFAGVLFAGHEADRAVVTFWRDLDAVQALSCSPTYKATVEEIVAAGFLTGQQSVELLTFERYFAPEPGADYDPVAAEYARQIADELSGKPFDRSFLDQFASTVPTGRVCDIGCGPGHIARHLRDRGVDVFGLDLSPRMIEIASRLNPDIDFVLGDLRRPGLDDCSLTGIVAFYALVHTQPTDLAGVLTGFRQLLTSDGQLLIAVHEGTEVRHHDQLWDAAVDLDFYFFTRDQLTAALTEAGFAIDEIISRPPYIGVEVETTRLYVRAHSTPS